MRSKIVPLLLQASVLFAMPTLQGCVERRYGGPAYAPAYVEPVPVYGPYGVYDRGDYDEHRTWHERDWWVANRHDWVDQHHHDWTAAREHPEAHEHHEAEEHREHH